MKSLVADRQAGRSARAHQFLISILLAGLSSGFLASCAGDKAFVEAYASLDRSNEIEKRLANLIRLDQEYPDRFALKHEIAMLYLQKGDPGSAAPFLERARTVAGKNITSGDRSTLFGGMAIVAYSKGEYAKAIEYGKKALAVEVDGSPAFGFITARAFLAQNKQKEALDYFDVAWQRSKSSMTPEDYRAYARALESADRSQDLVAVLANYEESFPYEPGIGLMQSSAYERMGDFDAAVLAAFKEAEYASAYGASRASDIQTNLLAIGRKLDDKKFNPSSKGKSALEAVKAFARRDWASAERLFKERSGTSAFEKYLLLSARIEAGHATSADIVAYTSLLPSTRSLPPYFYRLFLGFRIEGATENDRLADLLESAINLAPRTQAAQSYRQDLAIVLGLAVNDGALLLTKAELSSAASKAAATGESGLLESVVGTLRLKDNRTTLAAVGILRAFSQDAGHRTFLVDRLKTSSGRTRERLEYILAR
jgi:hypothetical protein